MEKKLTLKGFTILLAYYVLAATTFACKSGSEKSSTEKDNENAIEPSTEVILAPSQKKEGFLKLFKGDSTIHRIHLNDKILYESLILKDKRIYNFIFPRITDSFLFEDKYYLKISYPIPFSGTIETTIPDCPDYVLTPLANGILQVVIYNALDLSAVDLKFKYLPSEKDSLVSSVYHFKHIIFD